MGASTIERPKRKTNAAYRVKTVAEVAEFFGVTVAAVNKWAADVDPMPGRKGAYNLSTIAKWKVRRGTGRSAVSDELNAVDLRLRKSQAEAKELENSRERGELVELQAVDLWAAEIIIGIRENIMTLPESLATSSPPEMRDFIREESDRRIRAALTAAARKLESRDYLDD